MNLNAIANYYIIVVSALQKSKATQLESVSEVTTEMLGTSSNGSQFTGATFYDETALQRLRHDRVVNNIDKCDRAILLILQEYNLLNDKIAAIHREMCVSYS